MIALLILCFTNSCSSNIPLDKTATTTPRAQPNKTSTLVDVPLSTAQPTLQRPTSQTVLGTQDKTMMPDPTATSTGSPVPRTVEAQPFVPVLGGADKIAFFEKNEIWTANLDGSGLKKLTDDDFTKSSLSWSDSGEELFFISGVCIKYVNHQTRIVNTLTCFEDAQRLDSFQVSPAGAEAAVTLDGELYIVPFDPAELQDVQNSDDLQEMSTCDSLAPYKHRQSRVFVYRAYWSDSGAQLAILREGYENGEPIELVHLLDISRCVSPLPRLDEFPATRFEMENYDDHPVLQDFAWDGGDLFALTDFKRSDGFGDLWLYSSSLHRGFKVNPVAGKCCYRDPGFSPDGKYLVFAFQDANLTADNAAVLYYLPMAALNSSLVLPPLPLPTSFFHEPRSKPQPVLRTAAEN